MKNNNYLRLKTGYKCIIMIVCVIYGYCATGYSQLTMINTSFESAKTLSKGQLECMGDLSVYSETESHETYGESHETYGIGIIGLRLGYGFSNQFDIKLRYEIITSPIQYISISPRFSLMKDRIAGAVDIGRYSALYNYDEIGGATFISPRIAFTGYAGKNFDYTLTTRLCFVSEGLNDDMFWGLNLGLGLSSNPDKWVIRPEIAIVKDFSRFNEYTGLNLGLAFLLKFNTLKQKSAQKE